MEYQVITTKDFIKKFDKLTKKNKSLGNKVISILEQLESDPFYKGLRTHKMQSKNYGLAYRYRVTGDIRIIWDFQKEGPIILALTLGGHSGNRSVY